MNVNVNVKIIVKINVSVKSGKEGGTKINAGASLSQNGTRHRMHLQRNHQPTRPHVQCCALHGGDEMTLTVKCFLTATGLSRGAPAECKPYVGQ